MNAMTMEVLTPEKNGERIDEGVHEGMSWVRKVNYEREGHDILLFYPEGKAPTFEEIKRLDWMNNHYKFKPDIGFIPFDPEPLLTEMDAKYLNYCQFSFDEDEFDKEAWLDERARRPENADVKLDVGRYGQGAVHVEALRGCRVETITWQMPKEKPVIPFLKEKYGYIERNVVRPTQEQREVIAISSVGQGILDIMQDRGLVLFEKWHSRIVRGMNPGQLSIASSMVGEGMDVTNLQYQWNQAHRHVTIHIDKVNEWSYEEDPKGGTLQLLKQLPDSVVSGLAGADFSKVMGLPGAGGQKVKTARQAKIDKEKTWSSPKDVTLIRCGSAPQPVSLPERDRSTDPETIKAKIEDLLGPEKEFEKVSHSVLTFMRMITPEQILTMLEVIKAENEMNCEPFGHMGWTIRRSGRELRAEHVAMMDAPTYDEIYDQTRSSAS